MEIKELESKVNLLSLIKKDYKVKRIGEKTYIVTPCPICKKEENHFTVFNDINSYSSFFGCHIGGSVHKYLMEVNGLNEKEAYNELLSLAEERKNKKLECKLKEDNISHISRRLEITENENYTSVLTPGSKEKLRITQIEDFKPDNTLKYLENMFNNEMNELSKHNIKKTGFSNIDSNSVLLPQLYVIGGESSLGKTTFVHQMSDQIAELGEHVLYFSFEMSRLELVSKSLSRLTRLEDENKASNSTDIRLNNIKKENIETLEKAIRKYKEFAERISVIEGNFNTDAFTIRNYVEKYINDNKVKPVVVVDCLQILKKARAQVYKQKLDSTVIELKRISRDFNICVIIVSSLNKSNYLTPIGIDSFNGIGDIEYTADVILGLQFQSIHEEIFSKTDNIKEKKERINVCKSDDIRKIEIVVLKNRSGKSSYSCYFDYDCKYDLFIEALE